MSASSSVSFLSFDGSLFCFAFLISNSYYYLSTMASCSVSRLAICSQKAVYSIFSPNVYLSVLFSPTSKLSAILGKFVYELTLGKFILFSFFIEVCYNRILFIEDSTETLASSNRGSSEAI